MCADTSIWRSISAHIVNDLHTMTEIIKKAYPGIPVVLFGHSMGSFMARIYITRYGKELAGAIICGTGGPDQPSKIAKLMANSAIKRHGEHYRSEFINNLAFGSYNKRYGKNAPSAAWLSRDAAVIELLFATGIRISELCSLRAADVNLHDGVILIYGKGSKERRLYIGSRAVLRILQEYENCFRHQIDRYGHFFANQTGTRLTDQAIRRMLHKYASLAAIDLHITPHMFRHTFATSLLDADVDIRYIQEMLGHSSIHITEIYTHVAVGKQRDILSARHPRNGFHFDQPSTV